MVCLNLFWNIRKQFLIEDEKVQIQGLRQALKSCKWFFFQLFRVIHSEVLMANFLCQSNFSLHTRLTNLSTQIYIMEIKHSAQTHFIFLGQYTVVLWVSVGGDKVFYKIMSTWNTLPPNSHYESPHRYLKYPNTKHRHFLWLISNLCFPLLNFFLCSV